VRGIRQHRESEGRPFFEGVRSNGLRLAIWVGSLGALTGAIVTFLFATPDLPQVGAGAPLATTSPAASTPLARATDGTAGSAGLLETFDSLAIGDAIPGWTVSSGAAIDVAALPTAVDRSLRLTAPGDGRACREAGTALGSVKADFMVDALPAEPTSVVSLQLDDDSTLGVRVSEEGAQLTDTSSIVAIEPRAWYRWSAMADGDGGLTLRLSGEDGTVLAGMQLRAPSASVTAFCLTSVASARTHLNTLSVEAP
jgi:hypothetical protein